MNLVQNFVYLMILAYNGIVCVTECTDSGRQISDDVVTLNLVVREIIGRLDEKDSQLKEQSFLIEKLRRNIAEQQTVNEKQNERLSHLEAITKIFKHRSLNNDDVSAYKVIHDSFSKNDLNGNNVTGEILNEEGKSATHTNFSNKEKRTGKDSLQKGTYTKLIAKNCLKLVLSQYT